GGKHEPVPARRVHSLDDRITRIYGKQKADKRHVRLQHAEEPHAVLDFGDDLQLAVILFDAEGLAQLVNERQGPDELAKGNALPFEERQVPAILVESAPELVQKPRVAYAGLACHVHDLAAAGFHVVKAIQQHAQFTLAAHERSQAALAS